MKASFISAAKYWTIQDEQGTTAALQQLAQDIGSKGELQIDPVPGAPCSAIFNDVGLGMGSAIGAVFGNGNTAAEAKNNLLGNMLSPENFARIYAPKNADGAELLVSKPSGGNARIKVVK
jgi:hypothetical protein